jgi:hypothetical protein
MDELKRVKNPCILYGREKVVPVLGTPRRAKMQNEISFDWWTAVTKLVTKLNPPPSASDARLPEFVQSLAAVHPALLYMHQSSVAIYLQSDE